MTDEEKEEFLHKRYFKYLKGCMPEDVTGRIFNGMLEDIIQILPSMPMHGPFKLIDIELRFVQQPDVEKGLSYMTWARSFNEIEVGEYVNYLSRHGFVTKRYDIQPADEFIELTEKGRQLKIAGGFSAYQKTANELELELKEESELERKKLKQDVEVNNWTLSKQKTTYYIAWAGFILSLIMALFSLTGITLYQVGEWLLKVLQ